MFHHIDSVRILTFLGKMEHHSYKKIFPHLVALIVVESSQRLVLFPCRQQCCGGEDYHHQVTFQHRRRLIYQNMNTYYMNGKTTIHMSHNPCSFLELSVYWHLPT